MSFGTFSYPLPANEPVLSYAPGTPERARLKAVLAELKGEVWDMPMIIGGKEVRTGELVRVHPPHEIAHTLGHFHHGDRTHVQAAIDAALAAKADWAAMRPRSSTRSRNPISSSS